MIHTDALIGAFAKLASGDIGKRQVAFVLLCLACGLVFLGVYERYTSNFRFSRLEKATDLLSELNSMKSEVQTDEDLQSIHRTIVESLEEVVGIDAPRIPKHSRFWKFMGGMWPWLVLGLFTLFRDKQGKREFSAFWGFFCMGVIASFVFMFMPEAHWPWFHWLVYPFTAVFLILLAVIIGMSGSQKTRKSVAAEKDTEPPPPYPEGRADAPSGSAEA